jgi:hypothetical protein
MANGTVASRGSTALSIVPVARTRFEAAGVERGPQADTGGG